MSTEIKIYSAIDLLNKVLEFIEMTPNQEEWDIKKLASNPPRQIRLRQIQSMLSAFEISKSGQTFLQKAIAILDASKPVPLGFFLKGGFIPMRSIEDYSEITTIVKKQVNLVYSGIGEKRDVTLIQLMFIFSRLLEYKQHFRKLMIFNSGFIEASSLEALYSIDITNTISSNLLGKDKQLDITLSLLIDPKSLRFTEVELIQQFDYPTENLREIEMDYI